MSGFEADSDEKVGIGGCKEAKGTRIVRERLSHIGKLGARRLGRLALVACLAVLVRLLPPLQALLELLNVLMAQLREREI